MAYRNVYPAGTAIRAMTAPLTLRHGVGTGTLTGNITLTYRDAQILSLDPGGALRTVTLPAARDGASFSISNSADADERLTVYAADGSTVVGIVPAAGSLTVAAEDGTWVAVGTGGAVPLPRHAAQTIDMADAAVTLVYGAAGAGQVTLTSEVLYVDANSSGASENLVPPPVATSFGRILFIVNTGGEAVHLRDAGNTTDVMQIATQECAFAFCNGSAWFGGVIKTT